MGKLETTQRIAASPQAVWKILTDFPAFEAWNPLVIAASGEAREGTRLAITVRMPDGRERHFVPRVLKAEPNEELRWKGKVGGGLLFAGEHYFILEPAGTGIRFIHGEIFSGLLAALNGRRLVETMRPAYIAMNEALKRRAEKGDGNG